MHAIPLDELNFGMFSDAAWGVRPDGSSQGGFLLYATSHSLHKGQEALVGVIEWDHGNSHANAIAAYQPNLKLWPILLTYSMLSDFPLQIAFTPKALTFADRTKC